MDACCSRGVCALFSQARLAAVKRRRKPCTEPSGRSCISPSGRMRRRISTTTTQPRRDPVSLARGQAAQLHVQHRLCTGCVGTEELLQTDACAGRVLSRLERRTDLVPPIEERPPAPRRRAPAGRSWPCARRGPRSSLCAGRPSSGDPITQGHSRTWRRFHSGRRTRRSFGFERSFGEVRSPMPGGRHASTSRRRRRRRVGPTITMRHSVGFLRSRDASGRRCQRTTASVRCTRSAPFDKKEHW